MIDLPRDLAPWRGLLDLFPADLADGLGRLVPHLALAVGPMRTSRPTGDGEPDGFAGLGRRGSYERLSLTEWLLADEVPDEFLRRAANGEHAFFQLARRSPSRARTSVAIFDAGPDQLGAPRIAHLAALIVLAARAERAGARFAWGVLHRPDGALAGVVTQPSIALLLAARSPLPASADDVAAWAERARTAGWEDVWIVGGQTIVPGWKHASLEIRDVLDPDRRALAVVARAPSAAPREVELELPPDRACARLLRDPFSVAAPAPTPQRGIAGPVSNLVFAANGSKVFARGATGEILAYPVPNSPNAPAGRVKRYRPRAGGVVAAVGWEARGLVMLVIKEREIVLEHTTRNAPGMLQRTVFIPAELDLARPEIADPLSPLVYTDNGGAEIHFADARRALYRIYRDRLSDVHPRRDDQAGAAEVERVAAEVSMMDDIGHRLAFVGRGLVPPSSDGETDAPFSLIELEAAQGGWFLVAHEWPSQSPFGMHLDGDGTFEAVRGATEGSPLRGLVAVQQRGDRWTIFDQGRAVDDRLVPDDGRVVGVWRKHRGSAPELIVLQPDQRTLDLLGEKVESRIPRASAPITDVVVSTSRPQLAYVTTAGEVAVCSLVDGAVLARFLPDHLR